jgi:hypothetical protein
MDLTMALGVGCGVTAVGLVVGLWLDFRRWRARQRAATANWVLAGIRACEQHEAERRQAETAAEGERDGKE